VGILTVLLLVLARQSQQLIETTAQGEESDGSEKTGDSVSSESPGDADSQTGSNLDETEETSDRDQSLDAVGSGESSGQDTQAVRVGPEKARAEVDQQVTAENTATKQSLPSEHEQVPADAVSLPRDPEKLELTPAALLANVALTQGLVMLLVVAAAWYFSIPADALGIGGESVSTVIFGILFGTILWVGNELSTVLADAVGAAYNESVREMLAPDSPGGWVVLFGVVLPIIAIAEELLFRAALIGVPAAGFGVSPWILAVISSFAFALGHGAQGTVGIIVTGVLGFVLAAGYIISGSLLLVVVAHYVVNALEFFIHEYLGIEDVFASLLSNTGR